MRSKFTFLVALLVLGISTNAQFTIKVPSLPKADKSKPTSTSSKPGSSASAVSGPIYKTEKPTSTPVLQKNSIYIKAQAHDEYWKTPNESGHSSWVPMIRFNHFYNNEKSLNYTVEYSTPAGAPWYSEKLEQANSSSADHMVSFQSPSPYGNVLDTKSTDAVGTFAFKITDDDTKQTLFQGKFKVSKVSRANRPTEKFKFDFIVDQDWLAPYGMIGFHHSDIEIGGIMPEVSVWLNGSISGDELEAKIFYKGTLIDTRKGGSDYDERASQFAPPFAPHTIWKRWLFTWQKFRFDNNGGYNPDNFPGAHYADKNPGDYNVQVFYKGTLVRELNFTVSTDGRFASPAYMSQIPQPFHRVILPVKIIAPTDKYVATAWKTDSFYGNPISGF